MWDHPFHISAPLCISAPLTCPDECDFFKSLVVGLPYNLIFWVFWVISVLYSLVIIFALVMRKQGLFTYASILTLNLNTNIYQPSTSPLLVFSSQKHEEQLTRMIFTIILLIHLLFSKQRNPILLSKIWLLRCQSLKMQSLVFQVSLNLGVGTLNPNDLTFYLTL